MRIIVGPTRGSNTCGNCQIPYKSVIQGCSVVSWYSLWISAVSLLTDVQGHYHGCLGGLGGAPFFGLLFLRARMSVWAGGCKKLTENPV